MISQEEIEVLKEMLQENKDSEIRIARSFLEDIVKYFENQNKIGEWIPCSERLPNRDEYLKNDGRFIVTDGNRRYESVFDIYSKKFKTMNPVSSVGWFSPLEDKCVIAWQPLPAPYQSKEAKDGEKTE